VYALATSIEFQNAIGTALNIQTLPVNYCTGITFTDRVNCSLPNNLDAYIKSGSGISAVGQPVTIITSPGSGVIGLQFLAMQYVDNIITPTQTFYEYYKTLYVNATFQKIASPQSLHSNRDYEIGIVYMDEFNRATTALVSPNNTEHVACGFSSYQNSIQVTIPPTQLPPAWATRYKFVIKPDEENYETIYCSIYFQDPLTNNAYLLLEGENARKTEVGDRLIVKADSNGATSSCVYTTVLEKSSQASNFIEIPSELDPTVFIPVPAGVYIKVNPNSFTVVQDELAVIDPGKKLVTASSPLLPPGNYPILNYPMNYYNTQTLLWEDYSVPSGSRIIMSIKQWRTGVDCPCVGRSSTLEKTIIASRNYDNMYDWWIGDSIDQILKDALVTATCNSTPPVNTFIPGLLNPTVPTSLGTNFYQFYRNTTTNELKLMITGTASCWGIGFGNSRASNVEAKFTVYRAENTLIFETEPSDALPDVFFENEMSFAITGCSRRR
jgi:hypothetical protein